MKRKIIIGLSVFSLLFLISAIYVIGTIERATTKLDNLIKLHRVELLREQLLIEIKRAQSDLYLKDTRYARSMDTIVTDVMTMSSSINTCFECHHSELVIKKLYDLKDRTEQYKNALSRAFTIRANAGRLSAEEDNAFRIGAGLISEVNNIISMTNAKLEEQTRAAFIEISRTKRILYLLIIIAPLVALLLSVAFIRDFITRPVTELLAATRRLKNGDLSYRIEGLKDEYGEVAASFNEMAGSIRESFTRMQWAEQLVVLGEMAGGLAHEIKNPLAGIKASMEVISIDPTLSEENRDVVVKVIEQIKRIEVLLKSLLNFARPPKPQFMPVDLNGVLDSTVSLAQKHPRYAPQGPKTIAIVKDLAARLPVTMADPLQLQQVFMNLLLNAGDAMPNGGTVTVRTSCDGLARRLLVKIIDTGVGVDDAVADKIFQPFFTTKPHGTGLGLAITKRLIEQHGGAIRVEKNSDKGVSFTITLPIREEGVTAA